MLDKPAYARLPLSDGGIEVTGPLRQFTGCFEHPLAGLRPGGSRVAVDVRPDPDLLSSLQGDDELDQPVDEYSELAFVARRVPTEPGKR